MGPGIGKCRQRPRVFENAENIGGRLIDNRLYEDAIVILEAQIDDDFDRMLAALPPCRTLSRGFIWASSATSRRRISGSARRHFCSSSGSLRRACQPGSTSN